jgi:hypothetical protein
MKRLCARAAPGNVWDRRHRAPRAGDCGGSLGVVTPGELQQSATPVQASAGARVILSEWAWYAYQRTHIAPDLLVATGEAANG